MGADIHIFRERKINGVWETDSKYVDDEGYEYVESEISISRNYPMFGLLSNVRITKPYPSIKSPAVDRGFPDDIAEAHTYLVGDEDLHSHGCLYISELKQLIEDLKPCRTQALLGINKDNGFMTTDYLDYVEGGLKSLLNQASMSDYFAGCDESTEARILIAYDS